MYKVYHCIYQHGNTDEVNNMKESLIIINVLTKNLHNEEAVSHTINKVITEDIGTAEHANALL